MANHEAYLPEVLSEIEQCPRMIALNEIRNTIIDFCQVTTLWRKEHADIAVVADTADYSMALDTGEKCAGLSWAYLVDANSTNQRLTVSSEDAINTGNGYTDPTWRTETSTPRMIYLKDTETFSLALTPDAAFTLHVGVWIKPSRDSTVAPDFIYEKYLEAIACGAKARIMNMKTRPWYNPQAAADEMLDYKAARANAFADATRSHGRQTKSVVMNPIA